MSPIRNVSDPQCTRSGALGSLSRRMNLRRKTNQTSLEAHQCGPSGIVAWMWRPSIDPGTASMVKFLP